MLKYLCYILLLSLSLCAHAQDDVFEISNKHVRGFVRVMKLRSDMVRMVDDTLVYGENRGMHTYTFDDEGRILTDTSVIKNNDDTMCSWYIYNDDHQLVRTEFLFLALMHKFNISTSMSTSYSYTNNRLTEICEHNLDGKCLRIIRYQYNIDTVHVTVLYDFDEYNKPTRSDYNYFYDYKGEHITMILTYNNGKIASTQNFEYDEFGNPVRQKIYDENGNVDYDYTYEYIYDEHHNFTERFTYRFKQPFNITKRVITYQ